MAFFCPLEASDREETSAYGSCARRKTTKVKCADLPISRLLKCRFYNHRRQGAIDGEGGDSVIYRNVAFGKMKKIPDGSVDLQF